MKIQIVGAGLSGLIAAHAWPQARVFESSAEPKSEHKALLRFRSDAVAKLTGIDFRAVTVRKGIWFGGKFVQPSIGMANLYAQKVAGALTGDRSIWNLEPVQRWIAPETFYADLIANVGNRITWDHPFDFVGEERPIVSTAPLQRELEALGLKYYDSFDETAPPKLVRAPIHVSRWRISGADVYQTIYFPEPDLPIYRASMTGSMLIIESMADMPGGPEDGVQIFRAFGIDPRSGGVAVIDSVEQKYGKIVPLPDEQRRALLHALTKDHGVFSLGRFATWRNILLDDVVQDIAVLRRLLKASPYERALHAA